MPPKSVDECVQESVLQKVESLLKDSDSVKLINTKPHASRMLVSNLKKYEELLADLTFTVRTMRTTLEKRLYKD